MGTTKGPSGGRGARARARPAIAAALALALATGCGGGSDGASTDGAADGAAGNGTGDDLAEPVGDGAPASDGPGGEESAADPSRPPPRPDPGADDREGLVVEVAPGTPILGLESRWLAIVDLYRLEARPEVNEADVYLYDYGEPFAFRDHVDFYADLVELDTCEVRDLDAPGGGGGVEEGDGPTRVSGGEVLPIASPAGTFAELARTVDDEGVVYGGFDVLPAALPDGATLSIPGDVFPAVDAYPLGTPAPPVRLSPGPDEAPSRDGVYRWEPGDGRDLFQIVFLLFDDDDFVGFPVSCDVRDDGEFALPREAFDALESLRGRITTRFERVARRVDLRDGVAFYHVSTVAE